MNESLAAWLRANGLQSGQIRTPKSAHFDEFNMWPLPRGRVWLVTAEIFRQALAVFPGNGPLVPVIYVPLTFTDGSRYSETPEWEPPPDLTSRVAKDEPPTIAIMPKFLWGAKCPITYYFQLKQTPMNLAELATTWYRLCAHFESGSHREYVSDVVIEPSVDYLDKSG